VVLPKDLIAAERAADGMERLVEQVPGASGSPIGPQDGEQLVAAARRAAGGGDDREQRQPAPLRGGAGMELAVLLEDEPAESIQTQHGCGKDYLAPDLVPPARTKVYSSPLGATTATR
jgi:hypothetical protein